MCGHLCGQFRVRPDARFAEFMHANDARGSTLGERLVVWFAVWFVRTFWLSQGIKHAYANTRCCGLVTRLDLSLPVKMCFARWIGSKRQQVCRAIHISALTCYFRSLPRVRVSGTQCVLFCEKTIIQIASCIIFSLMAVRYSVRFCSELLHFCKSFAILLLQKNRSHPPFKLLEVVA